LCSLTARAALCAEMAEFVPAQALLYVEADGEAAQALVSLGALPPVAGMFMPQASDPFGYADSALSLPPGTVAQTAPHVTGVAFALADEEPLLLLAFDSPPEAARLLQGREAGANGLVELWDPDAVCMTRSNVLLLGSRDALGAVPGVRQGSLIASAAYTDARTKVADAPMTVFVAVPQLLDALRGGLMARDRDGFDAFTWLSGLDKADYLVTSLGFSDAFPWLDPSSSAPLVQPTESRITLHFADETAMLLRLLPQSPMRVAAEVPADAALTLALNWGDAAAFVKNLRDMVTQMAAVGGGGGAGPDPFAMVEATLGMTLDQFAATLGSGVAVSLSAGGDSLMIGRRDWTAALPLSDAAAFRAALDGIARNTIGAPLPAVEHEGRSIMQMPMAPVFLHVADDILVVAGSPENLTAYMDWRAADDRASLAGQIGEPPLAALLRGDLGRLLVSYPSGGTGTKIALSLAREGADLNLDTAVADLNPRQLYAEYMHAYKFIMLGVLMPSLHRARSEARRAAGKSGLRNIFTGLALYLNDQDGAYPESLAELVDQGYLQGPGSLIDPSDPNPQPIAGGRYRTSYEYPGGLPRNVPPGVISVYSRKGIHPDGRNLLSIDGAVLWATEWQLNQPGGDMRTSLRASYEAVVAAYGDALTPEIDARLRKFYEIQD